MFRVPTRRSLRLANIPPAHDPSFEYKSKLRKIIRDDIYVGKSHVFDTGIIFIKIFNILLLII